MTRIEFFSRGAMVCAAVAVMACGNDIASAQSSNLFGNTQGASSGSSSSRSGSSSGSSSLFGQTTFGKSGGQTGTTQSQFSAQPDFSSLYNGSSLIGNGFVGRNSDANNFVGRNAANGAGAGNNQIGRNTRANTRAGRGQRGRNGNVNGANNSGVTAQRQQTIRLMAQQRVAFDHTAVPGTEVEKSLTTRFNDKLNKRIDAKDLKFDIDANGILTMHGEVRTAGASELAEMIARMEPGVSDVRNELKVGAAKAQ